MKRLSVLVITAVLTLTLPACEQKQSQQDEVTETLQIDETIAGSDISNPEYQTSAFPYSFTAKDVYGNTVTEADLGEKAVYFVHYWATWCPPCVKEMPDLAVLAAEYGDRAGFIGLVDDYDTNLNGVLDIIGSAGIPQSFIMVDANVPSVSELAKTVDSGYLPTTVIIAGGKVVSEQIIGEHGAKYADFLDEYLGL